MIVNTKFDFDVLPNQASSEIFSVQALLHSDKVIIFPSFLRSILSVLDSFKYQYTLWLKVSPVTQL